MSRIVSGFRGSVAVVFVFVAAPAFAGDRIPSKIEFNRDVRPILAENCFQCHGPDSAARKADLRFDQREVAIEARRDHAREARGKHARRTDRYDEGRRADAATEDQEGAQARREGDPQATGLPRGRNINRTGRFWPRSVPRFQRFRMNRGCETRSIGSSSPRSKGEA